MRCHPFLYLCVLVTLITFGNVLYITKTSKKQVSAWKTNLKEPKRNTRVSLLVNDENTILSRIRYPSRDASVLYGHVDFSKRGRKLVLGIASVARPPGVDYLTKSLHRVLEAMDEQESAEVLIVVAMMDREKRIREERARILQRKFRSQVDTGKVIIVGPSSNIYPTTNFYALKRRPFNNTVERMEWQAKLSLDFAFLFSFCSLLGDFFMNLEDDVVPADHFVRKSFAYIQEREISNEDWSSLQFSNYLSIGRLYRSRDLPRLVELILISYTKMPVDFIMHHFDVMEMTDHFREYRHTPPLIEHTGVLSTIDVESIRAKVTRKYESYKKTNPPAQLRTNMTQWANFSLDASYRPGCGHFFWARHVRAGDVVDVVFKKSLSLRAVYIVTGFDREEERAGNDRLLEGRLSVSSDKQCNQWRLVTSAVDPWGKVATNASDKLLETRCLRLQLVRGTSDWLVIRLIRVMLLYQ